MTIARLQMTAAALIGGLAAFWFYLSSARVSSAVEAGTLSTPMLVGVGLASAVNLIALVLAAVAAYFLARGTRINFWFVVIVLTANCLTVFVNPFTLVDGFYLAACVVALGLVAQMRRSVVTQLRGAPGP
ncbi:MAG TPA: hypothetical protein VGP37_06860 [Candidatus Nanopelagicales bacterium]|nr:hypothetical protein [Candidatus Nanopelagicales bacterium]